MARGAGDVLCSGVDCMAWNIWDGDFFGGGGGEKEPGLVAKLT